MGPAGPGGLMKVARFVRGVRLERYFYLSETRLVFVYVVFERRKEPFCVARRRDYPGTHFRFLVLRLKKNKIYYELIFGVTDHGEVAINALRNYIVYFYFYFRLFYFFHFDSPIRQTLCRNIKSQISKLHPDSF